MLGRPTGRCCRTGFGGRWDARSDGKPALARGWFARAGHRRCAVMPCASPARPLSEHAERDRLDPQSTRGDRASAANSRGRQRARGGGRTPTHRLQPCRHGLPSHLDSFAARQP